MRKRWMVWIVGLMLATLLLAGCSSKTTDLDYEKNATGPAATEAGRYQDESTVPKGTSDPAQSPLRKQIRDAQIEAEAEDVEAAYADILQFAQSLGGYENARTLHRTDRTVSLAATLRIAPEHLDALIARVNESATVLRSALGTEDITEAYYDTETRLWTMEKSLESYYGFLSEAKDLSESMMVQERINGLTAEIESLKGKIRLWDTLLAESTVRLTLTQTPDPIAARDKIDWKALSLSDMGTLIRVGFTRVGNVIVSGLQWLAIVLVAASPVWLAVGVLLLVLRRRARKRKAAKSPLSDPLPKPEPRDIRDEPGEQ